MCLERANPQRFCKAANVKLVVITTLHRLAATWRHACVLAVAGSHLYTAQGIFVPKVGSISLALQKFKHSTRCKQRCHPIVGQHRTQKERPLRRAFPLELTFNGSNMVEPLTGALKSELVDSRRVSRNSVLWLSPRSREGGA